MFNPHFDYTNDMVLDLLTIERCKAELGYLALPTRAQQRMVFEAKVKRTHFSTSIEGNVLSYNQVARRFAWWLEGSSVLRSTGFGFHGSSTQLFQAVFCKALYFFGLKATGLAQG